MSTSNSTLSFHPTCPQQSTFQACGDIFLGCCSTYACTTKGCALGDLTPVSFDPSQHGKFPDASCGDGATFWTCTAGPTFWGCCKSNPCATGTCPKEDLVPAFVGNPVQSAYYLSGEGAGAAPTGTATATATASSSTSTGTGAAAAGEGEKSHTGAIAGGAAGGVVALLLICWLVYYLLYVRKKQKARREGAGRGDYETGAGGATTMSEHPGKLGGYYEGAPPVYTSPQSTPHMPNYGFQGYQPQPGAHAYQYNADGAYKAQHNAQREAIPSELPAESSWRGELESPVPVNESQVKSTPDASAAYGGEDGVGPAGRVRTSTARGRGMVFEEVKPGEGGGFVEVRPREN